MINGYNDTYDHDFSWFFMIFHYFYSRVRHSTILGLFFIILLSFENISIIFSQIITKNEYTLFLDRFLLIFGY